MSSSPGQKATVTILFLLIGLPPGLCSLYSAPETITVLRSSNAESRFYGMIAVVPCLVGFVLFGVMLWLLIKTWRQAPP